MASLESGPAIANGSVFAGSTLDRTIFALELGSGVEVWQADIGVDLPLNTSPAVSGGRVFVTTAFGTIFCLDEATGEVCWQADAEHASLNSSPVVVGSTVYVVDTAYGVSVFSTTDGGLFWSQQLELTGQVVVSPVVVNGTLFIGTSLNANTAYAATLWALVGSDEG
jgi:outer membrane protein assembly factor BamB